MLNSHWPFAGPAPLSKVLKATRHVRSPLSKVLKAKSAVSSRQPTRLFLSPPPATRASSSDVGERAGGSAPKSPRRQLVEGGRNRSGEETSQPARFLEAGGCVCVCVCESARPRARAPVFSQPTSLAFAANQQLKPLPPPPQEKKRGARLVIQPAPQFAYQLPAHEVLWPCLRSGATVYLHPKLPPSIMGCIGSKTPIGKTVFIVCGKWGWGGEEGGCVFPWTGTKAPYGLGKRLGAPLWRIRGWEMVARNLNDLRGISVPVCVCGGDALSRAQLGFLLPAWILPGVWISQLLDSDNCPVGFGLTAWPPQLSSQFVGCFLLPSLPPSPPSRLTRRRQLRPKPGAISMLGQTRGCQGTVLLSRPSVSPTPHVSPISIAIPEAEKRKRKGVRGGGGGEPQPINKIGKLGFLLRGAKRKESFEPYFRAELRSP